MDKKVLFPLELFLVGDIAQVTLKVPRASVDSVGVFVVLLDIFNYGHGTLPPLPQAEH